MKKKMSLKQLVDLLAHCVTSGIDIDIDINSDSDSEIKTISAHNPNNGKTVKLTFKVPAIGACQVLDWEETAEPMNKPED